MNSDFKGNTPGMQQQNMNMENQGPRTTFGLLKKIVVNFFKNIHKVILGLAVRSVISFLLVMFINFYAIAMKNEGTNLQLQPGHPWYYLLNLSNNKAAFSALCFFLFYVISLLFERIRGQGIKRFLKDLVEIPVWTAKSINAAGKLALPVFLTTAGIGLLFSFFNKNTYIFMTFAVGLFLSYTAQNRNLTTLFAGVLWSDMQRIFKPKGNRTPANTGAISLGIFGGFLGIGLLIFLPGQPYVPLILSLIFLVLAFLLSRRRVSIHSAMFVLGFAFSGITLLALTRKAMADDLGWKEQGGTVKSYFKSPGAFTVVNSGVKPGLLATAGNFIGGIFGTGYNLIKGAASTVYEGGKYVGGKIVDGAKYVGNTVIETGRDVLNPEILVQTVKNIGNDFVEAGRTIKDGVVYVGKEIGSAAKDVWNDPSILKNTFVNTAKDIGNGFVDAVKSTGEAIKDVYNDPQIIIDTIKGSTDTATNIAKNIGNAIYTTVTDPKKAWEFIKNTTGIENFENCVDPNRSLISRIGQVGVGTFKLYTTIVTAGQAGTAIKSGATKLTNIADDLINIGTKGGKTLTKTAVKGGKNIVKTIPKKMPVKSGPNYTTAGPGNVKGMPKSAQKAIQNVSDEMGVQVHVRYGNPATKPWIESGRAVPKPCDIKAKTLNKIDELIGGPQGREGLVGYFKPKRPPKNVMDKLSPEVRDQINKRFAQRAEEFRKYRSDMKKLADSDRYKVIDGVVHDMKAGKPVGGDVDIFDITNFDGTKLPESVKKQAYKKLIKTEPSKVMHEGVTSWDSTDHAFDPVAKSKMINSAKKGEEGVISFNPQADPTHSYLN